MNRKIHSAGEVVRCLRSVAFVPRPPGQSIRQAIRQAIEMDRYVLACEALGLSIELAHQALSDVARDWPFADFTTVWKMALDRLIAGQVEEPRTYFRRGPGCDVYVIRPEVGILRCQWCALSRGHDFQAQSTSEMVSHLDVHTYAGHRVPDWPLSEMWDDDAENFPKDGPR